MSDAVTKSLQTAPAPKTGMRRIPFPMESYAHPSLPLTAKRLINLMAEKLPDDARTQVALLSTPGLMPYMTVGAGPILAMNDDMPGRIYVVSGTHAYRIVFTAGAPTIDDMGDIGTSGSFVTIAVGVTGVVVCVPPRAYTSNHDAGTTLNEIGGDVFPGASSVCYVDGYYCFTTPDDSAEWFISRLLDPTAFDALDFAFSDAVPNVIRRVIAHRGQVWTVGEAGFEIWYDAGAADFPFRRASGGVISIGTNSPMSVCRADKSVWWLGMDGIVYRSDGYQPQRVSTHAIEAIIGNSVIGLYAMTHPFRGHWFYCLTTADQRTLVYDIATGVWHERSTSTDGSQPWQTQVAAVDNNSVKVYGDRASGQLYGISMQATDAGVTVLRQATLPPLWGNTNRAFCSRLEIEMEVGGPAASGNVLLEWSDDGARTWGPSRTLSPGAPGEFRRRVFTTRLGSFRQRTFRMSTYGWTRFYAVDADISAGTN